MNTAGKVIPGVTWLVMLSLGVFSYGLARQAGSVLDSLGVDSWGQLGCVKVWQARYGQLRCVKASLGLVRQGKVRKN